MNKSTAISFLSICMLSMPLSAENLVKTKVFLSQPYTIDKIYKSMEGPQSTDRLTLQDGPAELLWITGLQTDMVGADGVTPSLPEFMCHVNLDMDTNAHRNMLQSVTSVQSRILTLSQGQVLIKFPEGFGMPVLSNESFSLNTQVLNHNLANPSLQVRHKVTFSYIRDKDLKTPMKPLFNTSVFGMKLLEGKDGHFGMASGTDDVTHGPSCLPGDTAPNAHGGSEYRDGFQRKFTGHWVVKPGREENHTNVTQYLNLPYDTTLHYAAVHLHPYAESLELKDLTTGKTVLKSKARSFKDKIGLLYVDSFSSPKGVALYKNHQYDLISVYNNTSKEDKDSMAVLLIFAEDKQFKKMDYAAAPNAAAVVAPVSPITATTVANPPRIRMKTKLGVMTFKLFPDVAPKTVAHILELAKAGAYNTTQIYRIEPGFVAQTSLASDRTSPMTPAQRALLQPVPAEFSRVAHRRGALSLARNTDINSGESSFSIMLGAAPHLDGQYTVFGELEKGADVLAKIEKVSCDPQKKPKSRLEITSVDVVESKK